MLSRWRTAFREKTLFYGAVKGRHGPIRIVPLGLDKNRSGFVTQIEKALLLIGSVDGRRYRRIRREVNYILDESMLSLGRYNRLLRICAIDYARFLRHTSGQGDEWITAYFACLLVHEATHGHLFTKRIPYREKTRMRVERLCVRESERFAARLRSDAYNSRTLVVPFDASHWGPWRKPWRQCWSDAKEIVLREKQDRETNRNG